MVEIIDKKPVDTLTFEACLERLSDNRQGGEKAVIKKACERAFKAHTGQRRQSGEPFYLHAVAVAEILNNLHMDHETITAALLHDVVEDTEISLDDIRHEFGDNIARLVDGVTKMGQIQSYQAGDKRLAKKDAARAESLRKMLLAMAEDIRVVLIKLADRLHNMRTLASLTPDKQSRIAQETMEIFAPLANRLGIWQLKWELEDLSFRYMEPVAYKTIVAMLSERRSDREQYISKFIDRLNAEISQRGIAAQITGRPKHIYGIWKKMRQKGRDFDQIYDVRAVRIHVDKVEDCYTVLGVIHSLWKYIPGEFDDYIATPKENNYRSIHTAVLGPEGKVVEIQIRTHDMHRQAEYGVAAHWRYKEGMGQDSSYDEKVAWLRQLLEWKDEIAEAGDFIDQFKSELFSDRVYVLTPKGNIIDLPKGSTPLDFAYHVHTEVGHRCRGAKVNGSMVPLTYNLKTGDQVDVLTIKKGVPSRDWMNPQLGYLCTSKARAKVKQWFRHQDYEATVSDGRSILEKELKRMGITGVAYERIAKNFHLDRVEDLYAAIGRGDIKTSRILSEFKDHIAPKLDNKADFSISSHTVARDVPGAIKIHGVGNLLTHMGRCCKPVPGDAIVGYITLGRGVTVHRSDCPNVLRHSTESPDRLVEVGWGASGGSAYPVDIIIVAYDRSGLLNDITTLLRNESINVLAANTNTDKVRHIARMQLTLEINDIDTLSRVLGKIQHIPNVTEVSRKVT
ncbi:MAG: GTP diphosphokinase [Gammaproteobacteria bacterium]|nr:GTP diphosphokinase [Gammaproteobacteria bacterium]